MKDSSDTAPFSPFEWMLSLRYLRARRQEGFISVIAAFSFLGIMLGVATLIIVMAVMNGFRKELLDKILGLNGHLIVQPQDTPLTDYAAVAERISTIRSPISASGMVARTQSQPLHPSLVSNERIWPRRADRIALILAVASVGQTIST